MGNAFLNVKVPSQYEVQNGLTGLKRDIVICLCKVMSDSVEKIRTMIGISQELFLWKSHSSFKKIRFDFDLPNFFTPHPKNFCVVSCEDKSRKNAKCNFVTNALCSIFLSTPLTNGVFRWTVQISYSKSDSIFWIGAVHSDYKDYFDCDRLGNTKNAGSYSFKFWREKNRLSFGSCLQGRIDMCCGGAGIAGGLSWGRSWQTVVVPDKSLVSAELNTHERTLTFFVGEKKNPYGFSHIPVYDSHYFGMSCNSHKPCSITSLSLRRLASASPPSASRNTRFVASATLRRQRAPAASSLDAAAAAAEAPAPAPVLAAAAQCTLHRLLEDAEWMASMPSWLEDLELRV